MAQELQQINVLIVVDVEKALANNTLNNNVWLIDSNGYEGSWNQGQEELVTNCVFGQIINWSVVPVAVTSNVSINSFTGQMISQNICIPQSYDNPTGPYWAGTVEAQGTATSYQYSVVLDMDGTNLSFDPYINITGNP